MGFLAEFRTGVGENAIRVAPGYYVTSYLTADDPEQSTASKLTIQWLEAHADDGTYQVIQVVAAENARVGSIRVLRDVEDYPLNGTLLYITSAQGAQDPVAVWQADNRQNTAQQVELQRLASEKADIAHKEAQVGGALAGAAAGAAAEALRDAPNWVPWVAGGAVAVGGIWGLAKLLR